MACSGLTSLCELILQLLVLIEVLQGLFLIFGQERPLAGKGRKLLDQTFQGTNGILLYWGAMLSDLIVLELARDILTFLH
mmetsp:Transcript_23766/g.36447  ORF Transcript_23766/g.36447 Transcript_23766/m.36447 type:complete len:80 (-) Transcript_23766:235-474(-)|eukprot:CAMPEP_0170510388 /NCGR_PEP_ID=MMETSP0208-20121228/65739_1 /TAXON_ID=197538 /ORGANISM="Strombidium inclinatum, Strain S3" /LENGTH=79 /DNA_ID=CAMNT_0010793843 /DNA_START=890 /DNA_END=1129 /DNA_ORIENTATION=-